MNDTRAVLKELGWSDDLIDAFLADASQDLDPSVTVPDLAAPLISTSDLTLDDFDPPMSSGQVVTLKLS